MQTSRLLALASCLSLAVGCASAVRPAAVATDSVDTTTVERDGGMCQVVRRGNGAVRDARVAEHWPNVNYGTATAAFAGSVGGGARHMLLAFDLPELPAGAVITKARISLHKDVCGGSNVELHRVTARWDEASVTWSSFAGAYEPAAATLLPGGNGEPGRVSVDITDMARGWADGSVENDGVLLSQTSANTAFSTSESEDPSERPYLEVCWSVAPTAWRSDAAPHLVGRF